MKFVLFFLAATLLVGCHSSSISAKPVMTAETAKARDVSQRFGEAVLAGNWKEAEALIALPYRSKFTAEKMKAEYDDLISQIRFRDPEFKANGVEVDQGDLPATIDDARGPYHIDPVPDRKSWLGWMSAAIGSKVEDTVEQGVEAWILVIDDGGTPRIGHVNFDFLD